MNIKRQTKTIQFPFFFFVQTNSVSSKLIFYGFFSSKQTACNSYVCISDGKKSDLVCHRDKTKNDVVNKINQHS